MVSSITSLLYLHKQNLDQNHKLTKFYGNLHVQNSNCVSIIIETKYCFVQIYDFFNNHVESFTNTVTLMLKWIAKLMSITDYYINKSNQS